VPVDTPDQFGVYDAIDVDPVSGRAFLASARLGDMCVVMDAQVGSVSLDDGTIGTPVSVDPCNTGMAMSPDGGALVLTKGPIWSWPNLFPEAQVQTVDPVSMSVSPEQQLDGRSPMLPAIDGRNQLLVVGFLATEDFYVNNNAMSAVGAFDLRTGKRVFWSTAFNYATPAFGGTVPYLQGVRGIQVDPATRTGFTYGPFGEQIQQFSY
jgi:DNA-binding beta-propeller fold protein YncE